MQERCHNPSVHSQAYTFYVSIYPVPKRKSVSRLVAECWALICIDALVVVVNHASVPDSSIAYGRLSVDAVDGDHVKSNGFEQIVYKAPMGYIVHTR